MKLLNCIACHDILLLHENIRSCLCGRSSGQYVNLGKVHIYGPARIIGITSRDYYKGPTSPLETYPWRFILESERIVHFEKPENDPYLK